MTVIRRALLSVVLPALLLAGLAGCGSKQSPTGDADPAAWAPAGAPVYAEISIRPGEPLRSAVDSAAGKVSLHADWRARLIQKINSSSKKGATYEKDIDPWLGNRAGFFVTGPVTGRKAPYALILGVRDEQKLKDEMSSHRLDGNGAAQSASYKDVSYKLAPNGTATGVVKGSLVIASEAGFHKVVDVSKGAPPLTSDAAFGRAKSHLPEQRLVLLYVDARRIIDLAPQAATAGSARLEQIKRFYGLLGAKPVALALGATQQGITLESAAESSGSSPLGGGAGATSTPLLAALPGDSWLATASADFGARLKRTLASVAKLGVPGASLPQIESIVRARTGLDLERDLLGWMGDVALFVHGTSRSSLGGALVISSKDPAVSTRAVGRIGKAIGQLAHRPTKSVSVAGGQGFTLPTKPGQQPVVVVARRDRVVIAYGTASAKAALDPASRLGDASDLSDAKSALGSGLEPSLYLAIDPILKLAASQAGSSPKFQRALPYLRAYRFVVAGSQRSGNIGRSRLVVGLR